MPEGDTIHLAAQRLRRALCGERIVQASAPAARLSSLLRIGSLVGRRCLDVKARGKHLLIEFEGDVLLHSHLRMSGRWVVRPRTPPPDVTESDRADPAAGAKTTTAARRHATRRGQPWLHLVTERHEVFQYGGPLLELRTRAATRLEPLLAGLGPDLLAADFDAQAAAIRLRALDARLTIADALLEQRAVSGIGNIWRSEACFAAGIDPFQRLADTEPEDLQRLLLTARELMLRAVANGSTRPRPANVYGRAHQPCRRCGTPIRARRTGEQARTLYWCPYCQGETRDKGEGADT